MKTTIKYMNLSITNQSNSTDINNRSYEIITHKHLDERSYKMSIYNELVAKILIESKEYINSKAHTVKKRKNLV